MPGEDALRAATKDFGGFDHNAHALKLVTQLEHRYADFDGLNLTWETLEGLVKHNGPISGGEKPVPGPITSFNARWDLELDTWPGLEAQVAALADDIAYVNHDIDDGLRAGLFTPADLAAAPLAGPHISEVLRRYGEIELGRLVGEIVRRLMSAMVVDLIERDPGAAGVGGAGHRRQMCAGRAGRWPPSRHGMAADIVALKSLAVFPHVPPSPGDGLDGPGPGRGLGPLRGAVATIRRCCRRIGPGPATGRAARPRSRWCATISPE